MLALALTLAVLSAAPSETPAAPVATASPKPAEIASGGASAPCLATRRALAAGEPVAAPDVAVAPCPDQPTRAVRYDRRARTSVATRSLPAGSALGRVAVTPDRVIASGTPLTLRSVTGPVTVERAVLTLQTGRSGERVFVRDTSGAVFSVPLQLEDTP